MIEEKEYKANSITSQEPISAFPLWSRGDWISHPLGSLNFRARRNFREFTESDGLELLYIKQDSNFENIENRMKKLKSLRILSSKDMYCQCFGILLSSLYTIHVFTM